MYSQFLGQPMFAELTKEVHSPWEVGGQVALPKFPTALGKLP